MTRGVLFLITDTEAYHSIKFNGNMGYEDNGKDVIKLLKKVNNFDEFKELVKLFDEELYGHPCDRDLVFKAVEKKDTYMWEGFEIYDYTLKNGEQKTYRLAHCGVMSDYSYIKNATNEKVVIECKNGNYELNPGEILVMEWDEFFKKIKKPQRRQRQ